MSKNFNLANSLADVAGVKKEASLLTRDDHPTSSLVLQELVGDPDDTAVSAFSQFKPNPGSNQIPNPLSPIEGDDIFFTYMIPGAIFQSHDGQHWIIEAYDWDGRVEITNRWYPRVNAQVAVNDVRRSISAWIEPIQQTVPPPPVGVDYGTQPVKIVK